MEFSYSPKPQMFGEIFKMAFLNDWVSEVVNSRIFPKYRWEMRSVVGGTYRMGTLGILVPLVVLYQWPASCVCWGPRGLRAE